MLCALAACVGYSISPSSVSHMIKLCRYTVAHVALAAVLLCGGLARGGDLLAAAARGDLWGETRSQLAEDTLKGAMFREVDEKTYRFRGSKNLTIGGMVTREVLLLWDDERLHVVGVDTTIYNKGDDGALDKPAFEEGVKRSMEAISKVMQVEPKVRKVDKKEAGVKPRAWEWENENCAVRLEAFSTGAGKKYSSEFIRLTIRPERQELKRGGADDVARRSELKEHVRTDKEGSVWIDGIPMVDQGEKGYCVPAAISRVFAYYNMDGVDQHALAAICKSSGEEGTTIEAMSRALSSISNKFHMRITSWRWLNRKSIAKDYDKLAQRARVPMGTLDGKLLLEVIKSKPALLRKGLKDIRKYIDAGIPVVWGVLLGLYPEQGIPQSMGGHMRLIIGYNEEQQMIIYTDSWGAGHELKAMPLAQACAISEVLYVLLPLR